MWGTGAVPVCPLHLLIQSNMTKAKNEYGPDYWLEKRKWTKFLESLPLNKGKSYKFVNPSDMLSMRTTASILNHDDNRARVYSITAFDLTETTATITANRKANGNA